MKVMDLLRSRKPQHSPNAYTEEELLKREKSEMRFIKSLRKRMGFKIETIQVDSPNAYKDKSAFEKQ